MNKPIDKIWESYEVQKILIQNKAKFPFLKYSYENAIKEISELYGYEKTNRFISWLYEYMRIVEKISFEVGYNFGVK